MTASGLGARARLAVRVWFGLSALPVAVEFFLVMVVSAVSSRTPGDAVDWAGVLLLAALAVTVVGGFALGVLCACAGRPQWAMRAADRSLVAWREWATPLDKGAWVAACAFAVAMVALFVHMVLFTGPQDHATRALLAGYACPAVVLLGLAGAVVARMSEQRRRARRAWRPDGDDPGAPGSPCEREAGPPRRG
jgi:small-conductance mechanosensitive channel